MRFLKELIKAIFRRVKKPKVSAHIASEEVMPGIVVKKTATGLKIVADRNLSPEELMRIVKNELDKEDLL